MANPTNELGIWELGIHRDYTAFILVEAHTADEAGDIAAKILEDMTVTEFNHGFEEAVIEQRQVKSKHPDEPVWRGGPEGGWS